MTATIEEVRTHELTQFRWLPMGRSGGRHRAGFVSASGQVHVSLDSRYRSSRPALYCRSRSTENCLNEIDNVFDDSTQRPVRFGKPVEGLEAGEDVEHSYDVLGIDPTFWGALFDQPAHEHPQPHAAPVVSCRDDRPDLGVESCKSSEPPHGCTVDVPAAAEGCYEEPQSRHRVGGGERGRQR